MAVQRRSATRSCEGTQADTLKDSQHVSKKRSSIRSKAGQRQHEQQRQRQHPAWRTPAAAAALLVAVASAVSEWPIYIVYEKDLRRPALAFTLNLAITAVICLAVSASPQVRALKSAAQQPASAGGPRSSGSSGGGTSGAGTSSGGSGGGSGAPMAGEGRPQHPASSRQSKRQLVAALALIVLALYYGFGLYGPSGALTASSLSTFMFLVLP